MALAEDLFTAGRLTGAAVNAEEPLVIRRVRDLESFLDRLAVQITDALANADAYEAERLRSEALSELDRAKIRFQKAVDQALSDTKSMAISLSDSMATGDWREWFLDP